MQDLLEILVVLLLSEDLQALNERQACVDHNGELSSKD
jgi:hypothetical protein